MSSRVPNPLIEASPWVHGEALDELKLHQRIDDPLETLGGIVRTFNTDLASFYGVLGLSTAVAANTAIPWIGELDTAGCYSAPFFIADSAGLYLIAINLSFGSPSVAGSCGLMRSTAGGPVYTDPQAPLSHDGALTNNGGPRVGFPIHLQAGDELTVQSTVGFTVAAVGINWWFVQQLTWG